MPHPSNDSRTDDAIRRILARIEQEAPEGWRRIVFSVWALAAVVQTEFAVTMADGSTPDVSPRSLEGEISALREEMYEPDRGTWFSARFVLTAGGRPEVSFNLDEDPAWVPDVPPWVFAHDLTVFPRSEEHVPGWLRQRIDEAGQDIAPDAVS
ncbi:hypothetical protein [Prauserella flavalba]|uniref:Uncharacterized protein n=1 Tax=Prauserella flavalba TaxID=1477506 RepID=A0A318M542_9PSEU|nr:hypothetical protein [Prauserella flavalba]PXY28578.1 hypothetical protein BA062_22185 [Prauserella flavalba]